ncbi:GDH/6PGL endoplasmic bifunctional protein-like [Tubulanus polymorphus]|uniref:GDH/6PGL endoplasmic bifunctional protein-like n=1 Tax=Tubulanus polymorphus TaxID=672921 RepID=UPI003DA5136B
MNFLQILSLTVVLVISTGDVITDQSDEPLSIADQSDDPVTEPVVIVLVGATGDLAKKYLWQAIFDVYRTHSRNQASNLYVYGAARINEEEGSKLLNSILTTRISCAGQQKQQQLGGKSDECDWWKSEFIKRTRYKQLKTSSDYGRFCSDVRSRISGADLETCAMKPGLFSCHNQHHGAGGTISRLLFYLSIPPSSYSSSVRLISENCRPGGGAELENGGSSWLRVVLEKPFGSDHNSAQQLAAEVKQYLNEEQVFRVDHYLSKPVAKHILNFRATNSEFEAMLNNKHVDRIEIKMTETLDVKGRCSFYEQNCVIRDTLQNHLTELLLLVTMELPPKSVDNRTEIQRNKLNILRRISALNGDSVLLGQYERYGEQTAAETGVKNSQCPTFAAVKINIASRRWDGVPVLLISGKSLPRKDSSINIYFKNTDFRLNANDRDSFAPEPVRFSLSSNRISYPGNGMKISPGEGWKFDPTDDDNSIIPDYRTDYGDYYSVLQSVLLNEKCVFVSTEQLLESWRVWDPVLGPPGHLNIYKASDTSVLDFNYRNNSLIFKSTDHVTHFESSAKFNNNPSKYCHGNASCQFLLRPLVTGEKFDVIGSLASDIKTESRSAIENRGVFHLALSGGTSPIPLLRALSITDIEWVRTHVWLVDERCVPLTDGHSNFNLIHENLLKFVDIPYLNVHPMPVNLLSKCDPFDQGNRVYSKHLNDHLSSVGGRLDYTVLGLGNDGHTASIFPDTIQQRPSPLDMNDLCIYTRRSIAAAGAGMGTAGAGAGTGGGAGGGTGGGTGGETGAGAGTGGGTGGGTGAGAGAGGGDSEMRMSLTTEFISKSRAISVLVLGQSKRSILDKIQLTSTSTSDKPAYPILSISPETDAKLVWFIDENALPN